MKFLSSSPFQFTASFATTISEDALASITRAVDVALVTRKVKRENEQASNMHSDVRKRFFECLEVPFLSELPRLKRFDACEKSDVLLNEVRRFVGVMRTKYLAGEVKEVDNIQPEIRDNFWPNTQSCLSSRFEYEMINEKVFSISAFDDCMEAKIEGKTGHVIKICNSDFSSATLEDKQISLELDHKARAQVVSQVYHEIAIMQKHLSYVPAEYVGLLQNGPEWIAVLRKVVRGNVLWTYIRAPPAFLVIDGPSFATEINEDNCKQIARLIEHAYCTADKISEEIIFPDKRPMTVMRTIHEYNQLFDEDEGKSEDDTPPGKLSRTAASAGGSTGQQQKKADSSGRKISRGDGGTAGYFSSSQSQEEYFVLPLTRANVARQPVF